LAIGAKSGGTTQQSITARTMKIVTKPGRLGRATTLALETALDILLILCGAACLAALEVVDDDDKIFNW
jgi:hypothetical protein